MSRWFRHYAGMARDDKLVRVSIKSKQSIERVVWVWSAILESAAEIDDGGRYEIDHAEMARFLRCAEGKLVSIEDSLRDLGRVSEGAVAKWSGRQFVSDRSASRTKRYRDGLKGQSGTRVKASRDGYVTSQQRHGDAPELETETDTPLDKSNGGIDPEKAMFDAGVSLLKSQGKTEASARTLLGKWKRDHGPGEVIEMLGTAQRMGVVDIPSWAEKRWRAGAVAEAVIPI